MTTVAAVDLGASSGRVVLGHVDRDVLALEEVHRFPNEPVRLPTGLRWDVLRLWHEALAGLGRAARTPDGVASVGVDTWAVDYGLLDAAGELLGSPVHYRDSRTDGVAERFDAVVPRQRLYERNGLQHLPFTTMYQLVAARGTSALEAARRLLLLPDLLGHWLCGAEVAEYTNASTTGLIDVRTRDWSPELVDAVGVRRSLLPPLAGPGDVLGPLRADVAAETHLASSTVVTAVGSHDTASAVVGTPLDPERAAYVSCGTWALVGVETERPVLSEASRLAGFTNEGGVDGTIRYLHNVMGLWVLQESLRSWERQGDRADLPSLLAQAAALPAGSPVVDMDDPLLLPPGDMPDRVRQLCRAGGQRVPESQAEVVRCIVDNLAVAFAAAVRSAAELSGRDVETVHVVGGGARNELLCQLTADACGMPVVAGPVEATALGNVLVQARGLGVVRGDLAVLRDIVRRTQPMRRYCPRTPATLSRE
jgi:rhamnulokinase